MDEVIVKYKQKKFFKCLELLNSLSESDDVVENLLIDNCRLVCESQIIIKENDPEKIYQIQEQHYQLFQRVILLSSVTDCVPLQLKLIVTFNFIYWLLFNNDREFGDSETEEYLKLLHEGLSSVLGKQADSENSANILDRVFNSLISLKDLILNKDHKTVLLIFEFTVVVITFIIKLNAALLRKCLTIADLFIKESNYAVHSSESVNEFLQVAPMLCLCKFSLCGIPSVLTELNPSAVDCLYILQSVLLYLSEDFRGSLKSLQNNVKSSVKSLWSYLIILNAFELEIWGLCSGMLTKSSALVVEKNLKARFYVMQGKLSCIERNHKEALQQFKNALLLCPHAPIIYCYVAQVYGKMGVFDLMLENFQKLVQTLELEEQENDLRANFETTLLSWIHPVDEITEVEAYYALAISHGLNEDFKNACDSFERVLQLWDDDHPRGKKRSIELPSRATVLHEAAVMNLMLGNLARAEQITLDAVEQYVPGDRCQVQSRKKSLLCRDLDWLRRAIEQELLEIDVEPKDLSQEVAYSEDLIFFFPQNVIGLMILSEIQRIQGIEDYKTTLSTVFSMLSKYVASHRREQVSEDEKHVWTLVRAVAGKSCVKIAEIQMELSDTSNAEKMLKRALSCNKGDKDALSEYYKFLVKSDRRRDALKLWNTFVKEKESIVVDSLQSFSLRYILSDKTTKRELEKIQLEVESSRIKLL